MTKHTEQPEALRLAEALETPNHPFTQSQAAAELRRLHKVNQELVNFAELVSQLVIIPPMMTEQARQIMRLQDYAEAALAKAKGEQL